MNLLNFCLWNKMWLLVFWKLSEDYGNCSVSQLGLFLYVHWAWCFQAWCPFGSFSLESNVVGQWGKDTQYLTLLMQTSNQCCCAVPSLTTPASKETWLFQSTETWLHGENQHASSKHRPQQAHKFHCHCSAQSASLESSLSLINDQGWSELPF